MQPKSISVQTKYAFKINVPTIFQVFLGHLLLINCLPGGSSIWGLCKVSALLSFRCCCPHRIPGFQPFSLCISTVCHQKILLFSVFCPSFHAVQLSRNNMFHSFPIWCNGILVLHFLFVKVIDPPSSDNFVQILKLLLTLSLSWSL